MDWMETLVLALGLTAHKQTRLHKQQQSRVFALQAELQGAVNELDRLLRELAHAQSLVMEEGKLRDLQELAFTLPVLEVLSAQGRLGPAQASFLRAYLPGASCRYNLHQLDQAGVQRKGAYAQWQALAGLDETVCGEIWHTLLELACRLRDPQRLQPVIDCLGNILYGFAALESSDVLSLEPRYQAIIAAFNRQGAADQKTAYLHGIMLLQMELAHQFGEPPEVFLPCRDKDADSCIQGMQVLCFSVHHALHPEFLRFYAVRKIDAPSDPDWIWELPAGGGEPVLFFSEVSPAP